MTSMRIAPPRSPVALLALALAGCGPKAGGSGDDGGSGTAAGTSATSGASSGGGSSGGACDGFANDRDIGPEVRVRVTNATMTPIYLTEAASCGSSVPFELARDGAEVDWWLGDCSFTCEQHLSSDCGCNDICRLDTVVRVDPGGVFPLAWPGSILEAAELPPQCPTTYCGPECKILRQAPPGSYELTVRVGTEHACGAPACDAQCWDSGDGWCRMEGQAAGQTLQASGSLSFPDQTAVDVVF
jgi:hypothetical protein